MSTAPTPATRRPFLRVLRDDSGATAIEYALIASGISIVILGTVATLGSNVKNMYTSVSSALK
jgi:pilus assembly protein Flp/PilA